MLRRELVSLGKVQPLGLLRGLAFLEAGLTLVRPSADFVTAGEFFIDLFPAAKATVDELFAHVNTPNRG